MDGKRVMLNGSKGELVAKLRDYIQYEKLPYDIKGLAERPYAFIFKDHIYSGQRYKVYRRKLSGAI